jgi:hypothetical protein
MRRFDWILPGVVALLLGLLQGAHAGPVEDYLVDRSPLQVNGYVLHFTDAGNDKLFIAADKSVMGKINGIRTDGHILWDVVDAAAFTSFAMDTAARTVAFGDLVDPAGPAYLAELAGKTHPFSGLYVHYGAAVYDWIYVPYGTDEVFKLEGKNGNTGDLIWKALELVAEEENNGRIGFQHDDSGGDIDPGVQGRILFAHGMGDSRASWSRFANYAQSAGWAVYRYDVHPYASIHDRATQLAYQIVQEQDIPDASLVSVGHSMGGLDLRYIISSANRYTDADPDNDDEYAELHYAAARKIKKIYTLATPHKGNAFTGDLTPAHEDMSVANMKQFNLDYPYHLFKVDGRSIPFLAMRFSCVGQGMGDLEGDGVVALKRQSFNDAPHTSRAFDGVHTDSARDALCPDSELEPRQVEQILQPILDDEVFPSGIHNMVLFDKTRCEGDEAAAFVGDDHGAVNCLADFGCKNDLAHSVMLFPSIEPGTVIKLFNDPLGSKRDDWARIHVDEALDEPLCIQDMEHPYTWGLDADKISFTYHPSDEGLPGTVDGLTGKVSRVSIDSSTSTFDPDNIVFYEDNDCGAGIKGVFRSRDHKAVACEVLVTGSLTNHCDNDEIRSVMLYPGVPADTVIRVHNAPDGSRKDDWTRIHIGKTLTERICIGTFEQQRLAEDEIHGTDGITIDFRKYDSLIGDGLDGKISYIAVEESSHPYDPDETLVFYEALNCRQGVKGALDSSRDLDIDCRSDDRCDNDEISSLKIYPDVRSNRLIKVYNHPVSGTWDDWTRIQLGDMNLDKPFCLNGFEHQTSDRESARNIAVSYHPDDDDAIGSGLNGKISRIRLATSHNPADPDNIIFYEGNDCTQGIKGVFRSASYSNKNCQNSSRCDNDEIRSVLLYPGIETGATITVYNDPDGTESDDWARINLGQDTVIEAPYCINTFEQQRQPSDTVGGVTGITIDFHRIDGLIGNGLDGKISHVTIDNSDNAYGNTHDIVFFEGNDCTQGIKGEFHSDEDYASDCTQSSNCDNDEIRSMLVYPGVSTNRVIKLYNDPDGGKLDDWARIYIGDGFSTETPYCLGSFENQTTDSMRSRDIHIVYHRSDSGIGDGLDGKVSRVLIADSSSPHDPDNIIFYEGDSCTQEIKAVFRSGRDRDVDCRSSDSCANDEIRSALIFPGIDRNTLVKLYNDVTPGAWDDWTRIHFGDTRLTKPFCIRGFEHQTSSREKAKNITVNHHRSDSGFGNGLNGKISRVKIATSSSPYDPDNIVFYEGNNCTQEIKGIFQSSNAEDRNCSSGSACANDEIRSALLYPGIDRNTLIKVYNDTTPGAWDDWTRIHIGDAQFSEPFCINGFEHNTSGREAAQHITTSHHRDDSGFGDGLNGKISRVRIASSSNARDPDDIVFYSDRYCTTGIAGVFQSSDTSTYVSCKDSGRCKNDAIKSVLLYPGVRKHKAMRLYDHPDGKTSDDYTSIYRRSQKIEEPFCIRGLEHDTSPREAAQGLVVNYHKNNGLNGKVSYIKIVPSDKM